RFGSTERERRRYRAGSSSRLHRREADGDNPLRNAAAKGPVRAGVDVRGRRDGRCRNLRKHIGAFMTTLTTARGGSWLIEDTAAESVFTPEQLSDEHRLIGQTADEFVSNEVLPAIERLEQKDWELARRLVRRAGELGLLGTDVGESFGGVGLDKVAS